LAVGPSTLSRPLTVKKDPHSEGSEADIRTQTARVLEIRRDLETTVRMVNQIELLRRRLYDVAGQLGSDGGAKPVTAAAEELDRKLVGIEGHLVELKLTGEGQDTTRWPARLVAKLMYLANGISGNDLAPSTQQVEVHEQFKRQIAGHQAELDRLLAADLAAFNALLRGRGLKEVVVAAR
jgi:hypothetical protein